MGVTAQGPSPEKLTKRDQPAEGERDADTFTDPPDGRQWFFDRCPLEDSPELPWETGDPCEGCPGWGIECGAIYARRVHQAPDGR